MIGVQQVKAYQAPAADGVYYIQNVKTGKFVNYGWNYGARIGVDDYGTAWRLIADGDNFKIQAYVTNDRNFQDDTWMYSDGGGDRIRSYTISSVAGEDGVYTLMNTSNNKNVYVYLKEDGDKYFVAGNAIKGDNYNDDDQTYWRFLSQAERDAYIAAQVHEREAAILAAYGFMLPANKTLSEYLEESPYFKQAEVEVAEMSGWTWTSMPNTNSTIAVSTFNTSALEVYQGEGTSNNKLKLGGTLSKTLEGLSAGLYKVTVPAMYRFGANADCYANERTNGYKGLNGGGYVSAGGNAVPLATWASSCKNDGNPNSPSEFGTIVDEGYYQNVTFANVTGTTLDLAISIPGSIVKGWFCTKQATAIRYNLKTLSDAAIAYPANGELAAGQWYKFTVTTAGDYGFDVIDGVVLTTDGNQSLGEANGDALTHTVALTTGTTYYIKSETAQTVTKTASPYTYTIGTAASDKVYIQPGNTVTVSYGSMTTDNTYASELSSEITGVTLGGEAISVTRTTKGFTFTVPEVTKGADYILSIPADIIGYDAPGSGKNEAQEITLKTPAILNGVYFLKANSTWNGTARSVTNACGKYLARGNAYGTHATIDKYGLPIIVTTNEENVTTLQPADTRKYYYHSSENKQNWHCWADRTLADNDVAKFSITLHSGEYRIHNVSMASGTYLKYDDSAVNNSIITVFDDGDGTNAGPIINWTTETPEEHAVYLQGLKNTQAATAATAAYSSEDEDYPTLNGITTISGLDAEISENYTPNAIKAATDITSVVEKYEGAQPAKSNTGEIVYSGSVEITDPGLYKFSMQAFYRAGSNEVTQEMHTNGYDFPPVALFFGNAETPLKSLYDESGHAEAVQGADPADVEYNGEYYANCMNSALKMFQDGKFHNDVWLYVSEAGTYDYGVRYQGYANTNAQWFIYTPQSVSVTGYTIAEAEEADYTALNTAIEDAEAKFGFEKGDCAPYNNLGVFTLLNAAKDINPAEDNLKYAVHEATDALNDFEWSVNATELNAFYGGDFTKYETVHNAGDNRDEDYPYGWNLYHGDKNRSRIMGGTEGDSNAGLDATTSGKALLLKFNATYGESEGYTMPLKAGQLYKITFKHGRWAEANPRVTDVIMTDPDGASITLAPGFQAQNNDCQSYVANWEEYTGYFVSTKAGNYKFNLTKQGGNTQMQIAIGDIELKLLPSQTLTFADNAAMPTYAPGTYPNVSIERSIAADTWSTLVLPVNMRVPDGWTVKKMDSYDTENGLTFAAVDDDGIEAGKPYMVKVGAPVPNIVASNVAVTDLTLRPIEDNGLSMTGVYEAGTVPVSEEGKTRYVVSGNQMHKVTSKVNIKPFRAYFELEGDDLGARIALNLDNATAINTIEAAEAEEGVLKDGKYLIEGKIVLVKNGVKYDANGKKLN